MWFPFFGNGKFHLNDNSSINVPRKLWPTLPNVAKIIKYGGQPSWQTNGDLRIDIDGVKLVTSPHDKSSSASVKEIFSDNEYLYPEIDYHNKTVLDIGANIGDSSIFFASQGASKVLAFEPLPSLHRYLQENISLNEYDKIVIPYYVGLGLRQQKIDIWLRGNGTAGTSVDLHNLNTIEYRPGYVQETLEIENWKDFFGPKGIQQVDIVKMDCEMCEYKLLKDDDFLKFLNPQSLIIEYHDGIKNLVNVLENAGFKVQADEKYMKVGMILAYK